MDHRERIQKAIARENVDHIPISFWRHFPVDDQSAEGLAKSTLAFQNLFDFDFVKVSPSSSFCIKDWGAFDTWKGNLEGTRDYQEPVIKNPKDWKKLPVLDPRKGHLGKQLDCLKLIKKGLNKNTPFIQSIFSPLAQAKNLVGKPDIQSYLRMYPDEFLTGLDTIKKSTARFIEECKKIGIDGLFYAVQFASYDLLSEEEFLIYGKKSDAALFDLFEQFWFNLLHVHGRNIMFDIIADYPFQVINWHDRETPPDLGVGKAKINGAVCGGIGRIDTMVLADSIMIENQIKDAVTKTEGLGLILGTGCVLPQSVPWGNIYSAVEYTRSIKL